MPSFFELDDSSHRNFCSKNGIFIPKIRLIIIIVVVVLLLIILPIITYFSKPVVDFKKIKATPSLAEKVWNDVCIDYACKNYNALTGNLILYLLFTFRFQYNIIL